MSDTIKYGDVLLAAPGDSLDGFRAGYARATQERRPLRAPHAGRYDRRGVDNAYTFRVNRLHESAGAARVFIQQHKAALAAETATTVVFDHLIPGGGTFTLHDAVVEAVEAEQSGATSWHTYTVVGGRIS